MSFAAMAPWLAWLTIGVVVAAAVGLFLIKIKPPQIAIPSLTLWARVLDEKRDRTLWERIRKAVSLALAVLITLALAFAVLRPQLSQSSGGRTDPQVRRNGQAASGARTSIVIDSSWSMLAQTSSGQTRWDRAIARARALAVGAGGEDVVLSTTADGVVEGPTADVALIEAALDRISPSGGAMASWPRVEGASVTHFLTDGAVARALDPDVVVESVFDPADNVAITAFDVGPATSLDSAGQAFLDVANYSMSPQNVRITVTRGSATVLDVRADLAAGAAVQRAVPLARAGDAHLRARVSAKRNALVIDDEAVAWIPGTQPVAVVVVSDKPESFGPLLSQDPAVRATFVRPAGYVPGPEEVVIFDRTLPAIPAKAPALFIAPSNAPPIKTRGSSPAVGADGEVRAPAFLSGADLTTMNFETVRSYALDDLTPVAFSETHAPLVLAHEEPEQRFVLFAFGVTDSKLMFAPGFPALMASTIDWLAHPIAGGARRPGSAEFEGHLSSITGPDGKPVTITQVGAVTVADLARPGFYQAVSGGATSTIAVNAGDPEVSDLQHTRLPAGAGTGASDGASRGRPWWLFALSVALMFLAVEWWTWQRRVTV